MSEEGQYLEQILYKLLDFQSTQGSDCTDTMLMLSLVNLLGIVSLLNKQSGVTELTASRPEGLNPVLQMLLNMLGGHSQQQKTSAAGIGQPPVNPALLMNLLKNMQMDPSFLVKMLENMLAPTAAGTSDSKKEEENIPTETSVKTFPKAEVSNKGVTKSNTSGGRPLKWGFNLASPGAAREA